MPLIVSENVPRAGGDRRARGQRASGILSNQAQAELERMVDAVLVGMKKLLGKFNDAGALVHALGELQANWQKKILQSSAGLAAKWIIAVDSNSKAELAESLKRTLGISQAAILDTPEMKELIVATGKEATMLIRSVPVELLSKVQVAIEKAYSQEELPEGRSLAEEIEFLSGHSKKRARLIARDQTQKMHGAVTRARQASLGVEEFIWRTMKDSRVVGTPGGLYPQGNKLHGNHYAREGKKYRWDELPPDGAPGWGINCRCYAEPVVNLETLDIVKVSPQVMEEFTS